MDIIESPSTGLNWKIYATDAAGESHTGPLSIYKTFKLHNTCHQSACITSVSLSLFLSSFIISWTLSSVSLQYTLSEAGPVKVSHLELEVNLGLRSKKLLAWTVAAVCTYTPLPDNLVRQSNSEQFGDDYMTQRPDFLLSFLL